MENGRTLVSRLQLDHATSQRTALGQSGRPLMLQVLLLKLRLIFNVLASPPEICKPPTSWNPVGTLWRPTMCKSIVRNETSISEE
jgi:hypothetical protein